MDLKSSLTTAAGVQNRTLKEEREEREYRQKGQLKSLNETELSVADTSTCVQN